jgi:hypothetical protein
MPRASNASGATSTRSRRTGARNVRLKPGVRHGVTFDAAREIGLTLPDAEETAAWGTPVLKVKGRIFTGIPINKDAEPGSIMFSVDFAARDAMIAEQPDVYYTAPHYENYPCVLARLSRLDRDVLDDLVRMAHRYASSQRKKRPRKHPRT